MRFALTSPAGPEARVVLGCNSPPSDSLPPSRLHLLKAPHTSQNSARPGNRVWRCMRLSGHSTHHTLIGGKEVSANDEM